jgi:hypothetical protein
MNNPIVIGCLDLSPGAGGRSIVLAHFGLRRIGNEPKKHWRKSEIHNYAGGAVSAFGDTNVDIFDGTDFILNPDNERDMKLLHNLLHGFDKFEDLDQINVDDMSASGERPDHFFLAVSARALMTGTTCHNSFFFNFWSNPKFHEAKIQSVVKVYKAIDVELKKQIDALKKSVKPDLSEVFSNTADVKRLRTSSSPVHVLVTDVNAVFHHDMDEVPTLIRKHLEASGIPSENILILERRRETGKAVSAFGGTWKEEDLVAHEKKIADAMAKAAVEGNYYTDYLTESPTFPNCKHELTEDSKKHFAQVMQ